jgi:hypothetical protein
MIGLSLKSRMRWVGHVAHTEKIRNVYKTLIRKSEGQKPLRRTTHRWEVIRMDLRERGWESTDWIHLAQNREPVEGCCEHGNEPLVSIKARNFLTSQVTINFSRKTQLYEVGWSGGWD